MQSRAMVARRSHNPQVAGSNPASATNFYGRNIKHTVP